MTWVLRSDFRRIHWFKAWTAIGPCATQDVNEAAEFATREAAMTSPAFSHWGTFYEPVEMPEKEGV